METLHEAPGTDSVHTALTFSPDGSLLASATCTDYRSPDCRSSEIWLWDPATGDIHRVFKGQDDRIHYLQFSPDSQLLAGAHCTQRSPQGGCQEHAVQLWDVASGDPVHALPERYSSAIGFSPDGRWLATVICTDEERPGICTASEVVLWHAASRQVAESLSPPMSTIPRLAFTPDGRQMLLRGRTSGGPGQRDYSLMVWDLAEQSHTAEAALPEDQFWCSTLGLSPDGGMAASTACDGNDDFVVKEILVWSIPSLKPVTTLTIPPERYLQLAFAPDGRSLAALGTEGVLSIWNVGD